MANKHKYNPSSLLDIKFEKDVKGYNPHEVDKVLDEVIEDYEYFLKELKEAKEYIAKLEAEVGLKKKENDKLMLEYTKAKAKLDRIGDTKGVTSENIDYIVRIRDLEAFIYKLGHDPKKLK